MDIHHGTIPMTIPLLKQAKDAAMSTITLDNEGLRHEAASFQSHLKIKLLLYIRLDLGISISLSLSSTSSPASLSYLKLVVHRWVESSPDIWTEIGLIRVNTL